MQPATIPVRTQILVIGGGPAGSYAASALAREGFQVTILESDTFPRYHIGESLLPSARHLLTFIDVIGEVESHGFCSKPGAAIKFNQHKKEGYTDFTALGPENTSWNVVRSEFDDILLRHAATSGAKVFQQVKVTDIAFEGGKPDLRPIAAVYKKTSGDYVTEGIISFDCLVDATGRRGLMSTKYLKNRLNNQSLNNVAIWGYWGDETGWVWFIPLHDGTVSIGVVQSQAQSISKRAALCDVSGKSDVSLRDFYLDQLNLSPGLIKLMATAELIEVGKDGGPAVRQASDYSYAATNYSGIGYRLVGDAAAFIDPFFSSGVHLAFTSGLSAAATIASSIRGVVPEALCVKWHDAKVGTSYTRFLLVVQSAYKQIRAQQLDVLSDINEDNFDRAFDLIRPVIQGTADVNKKLTNDEVQKTLDFVKCVFAPIDPEVHAAVKARLDPKYLEQANNDRTNILLSADPDRLFPDGEEIKHVLSEVNARKSVCTIFDSKKNLGSEPLFGYTIQLERGKLNMVAWNPDLEPSS